MKSNQKPFQRAWTRLLRTIDQAPASSEDRLRLKYFLVFVIFGICFMTFYGAYHLYAGNLLLFVLIAMSAAGLVVGWMILLRLENGKIIYRLNGMLFCVLLVYMLIVGGEDGSKALWMYIFPLIAFFLLGQLEGLIWSGSLLLIALACFLVPSPFAAIYPYSNEFITRFTWTYLIICAITFWFEHFRASYRQQLESEHRRFQDILAHSREILYRRDLQSGQYLYVSKAFAELLGYRLSELETSDYRGIEALIHPDDLEKHNSLLRQILDSHASDSKGHTVEYRMRHKDGTHLWFSDQIAVIYDANGQPQSIIGSNREITQQRQMKQALKEARDQLLTILDSIDAHIYVADMQTHRILFTNSKMRQDFGRDMQGGICYQEFREQDGPCEHCSNDFLLDDHGRPTGVYEWECYNPIVKRWYNNYDRAIQWLDGTWVRIQIAVDISRIKEMEKERERNQEILRRARHFEAIGTLAGGIAHDFNNLLQIILGNISLMEYDPNGESDSRRNLEEIKNASHKARDLANRLVTFSTGGAPHKIAVPITHLLKKTADELTAGTAIVCRTETPPDLWPTPIDHDQMAIVLNSVIGNACESTVQAGRLDIRAENYTHQPIGNENDKLRTGGRYVKVRIQDNGSGIPEADLPKIFEPYFSTKRRGKEKGLGLSLSISYSIVQQHDGHISVSSQSGQGTIVDIYLPADSDAEPHGRHPDSAGP